jgi:hypothetical protein
MGAEVERVMRTLTAARLKQRHDQRERLQPNLAKCEPNSIPLDNPDLKYLNRVRVL